MAVERPTKTTDLREKMGDFISSEKNKNLLSVENLVVTNVSWDDTSRKQNSSVGSNISDLTLQVDNTLMPIIRFKNFSDITVDMPSENLPKIKTNQGYVTLHEYLSHLDKYIETDQKNLNLWADRDTNLLVSAQACILPLYGGKVYFVPHLYNYQSTSEPACLVITISNDGTSTQVVTNDRHLYFNDHGVAKNFVAERSNGRLDGKENNDKANLNENQLLIIQVPLKQKQVYIPSNNYMPYALYSQSLATQKSANVRSSPMGMESAIVKPGETKGVYRGLKNDNNSWYQIERDKDRPIRVTYQFYHVTDDENLKQTDVAKIAKQIESVYELGKNKGSLVLTGGVSYKYRIRII